MQDQLASLLKGKVVIVGIGHPLRGDDGLGPALISRLKDRVRAVCLDAGSAPENYAGVVIREAPDTVLLIDAVHLERRPGAWEILEEEEIARSGLSTHDLSPKMFIEYLRARTRARIYLLGVQPQNLTLGDALSESVLKTLEEIEGNLKEVLPCTSPI